jgi:peptide/nickel transport system permease protein
LTSYILRRCGTSLLILVGISIFIFGLLHSVFPSPARVVLGPKATLPAINIWNREHGFAGSVVSQYLSYMNKLAHGDLGFSFKLNQSVTDLLKERWMFSAYLSGVSLALSVLVAIPLGIYQAIRRNRPGDMVATSLAFTAYAMPDFLLYLIAVQIFALTLKIFSFAATPQNSSLLTVITDWRGMTLPIVCLTILVLAGYSRYMRSSAMDTLAQDYIRVARAKGLPERLVLSRHLLKNAILPMITLVGLSIPSLLAGNLIAEFVFNYNGLGLMFYNGLQNEDYPVLLAYTLLGAVLTVAGNLVADIALTVADPRIRLA